MRAGRKRTRRTSKYYPSSPSSHCSSVQERLVNYGSEALDTIEHLGLILKDQEKAFALLEHFGSIANLARASVQDLSAFLSRDKATQLVSSLRLAAVALREERKKLVIDTPLAVAELCTEMRFLSHESLRVILLNTKQQVIKIVSVSQGTLNETLSAPREIFKPVITFSAFAFVLVHNHCDLLCLQIRPDPLSAPGTRISPSFSKLFTAGAEVYCTVKRGEYDEKRVLPAVETIRS